MFGDCLYTALFNEHRYKWAMEVDQSDYEEGGDVSSDDDYSPGSLVIDTEGAGECKYVYTQVCEGGVCRCVGGWVGVWTQEGDGMHSGTVQIVKVFQSYE